MNRKRKQPVDAKIRLRLERANDKICIAVDELFEIMGDQGATVKIALLGIVRRLHEAIGDLRDAGITRIEIRHQLDDAYLGLGAAAKKLRLAQDVVEAGQ